MDAELIAKLRDMVSDKLDVPGTAVTPEALFIDDLGADSLDMAELALEMEELFGIEIPDDDHQRLKTVGDALVYVEDRLRQAS